MLAPPLYLFYFHFPGIDMDFSWIILFLKFGQLIPKVTELSLSFCSMLDLVFTSLLLDIRWKYHTELITTFSCLNGQYNHSLYYLLRTTSPYTIKHSMTCGPWFGFIFNLVFISQDKLSLKLDGSTLNKFLTIVWHLRAVDTHLHSEVIRS